VAISGSIVVIGAYQSSASRGVVYVFGGSGEQWTQKAELTADDGVARDCLGWSVAAAGTTVFAGAPFAKIDNVQLGAVYVFSSSGGNWAQSQKLIASGGQIGDFFGDVVAADGKTAVIGADSATVGNVVQGAAYVFDGSTGSWLEQAKLTADDGAAFDNFGRSVAISGSTVLVGAPYVAIDGNAFEGAAYVFDASGASWRQTQKLVAGDGTTDTYFGWSVAVSGTNALVGASSYNDTDQGQAYAFAQAGGQWTQTQELVSGDGPNVDLFGWSVAVSDSSALIGEPFARVQDNYDQGATFFYGGSADVDLIFADGFDGAPGNGAER
jgi:hypothetical protein